MANSTVSLSCVSLPISRRITCQMNSASTENLKTRSNFLRRCILLSIGAASTSITPVLPILADTTSFEEFVDRRDGYTYKYPADWREFDFRGHDSAFKDRFRQLQNVRVRFIPTEKTDIQEMGTLEEVVNHLATHVYPAPNQRPSIMSMEEKTVDGTRYYSFEYALTSPNYTSVSFATVAVGNGRYYTLIVGANGRRWRRFRNFLKEVSDSFRILEI